MMCKIKFFLIMLSLSGLLLISGCQDDNSPSQSQQDVVYPGCTKDASTRSDNRTPETVVADWSQPTKLQPPVNTLCPEDAIEISDDGQYLYFMFTADILDSLSVAEILAPENNTFRVERTGGPGTFGEPVYYDLAKGTEGSLDGELCFNANGSKVYFHSNRAANLGYNNDPYMDDFQDIYVADIIDGTPGEGRNLGGRVNSVWPDGEHALHPDDSSLYFASLRPGGHGGADIWLSVLTDTGWTEAVCLDTPLNSVAGDLQPTFTADGDTVYFTSDRGLIGAAVYRSVRTGERWGTPELVIRGVVGEPSLTADGRYLYFVHVLSDAAGVFDADIYYCERVP
ncbi:MAG: TolB family protein [Candidatus Zixiibacteriota bacterium]